LVAEYEPELEVISGSFFRRDRVVPAMLAIVAILLATLIVRDAFFPPGPAVAAARTATVSVGNVQAAVAGTGTVEPDQQQNVNFRVSGTLTEVDVQVGQQVTAGQTLARLDSTDLQAAVDQAQATLNQQQANLAKVAAGATPEQAALARRIDRETQERCGEQGSVLDYPYLAGLKANKEPSIGRKFHCRGCT